MFRYMAFVWDPSDRTQTELAQGLGRALVAASAQWRAVLVREGVCVLCADPHPGSFEPRALPNGAGVILGALFEKRGDLEDDSPSRAPDLAHENANAITASRGRWLIENCWGDYVALLCDARAPCVCLLKDPIGALPCYATETRGIQLFFSCIADCIDMGLAFAVEHSFLRRRVIGGASASSQAALAGVSQIHGGECVELRFVRGAPTLTRSFHWNPLTFAEGDDALEDAEHAARALRATVCGCTRTWAVAHSSVLHRLSGGLDSSIVAGCLAGTPTRPRLTSYTYFNPHGRSDERPWARLAAAHAGGEHLERPITPADIDLTSMLRGPASVEPLSLMSCILRTTVERPLARECEATAVFTGDGGDSGFGSESIAYVVQEFLRRRGLRLSALRLSAQVGLHTHRSAWSVLARALRAHVFGRGDPIRRDMFVAVLQLVAPELREEFSTELLCPHPWFAGVEPLPWATLLRLGALLAPSNFYQVAIDAAEPCPPVIAPLYSQPVTELCLRIPLHTHFEHGRDRGLARRAFAREAPATIRERVWKDRAPGFHDELVRRHREFLLTTLHDGVLAGQGLLDRAAVRRALSESTIRTTVSCVEILRHAELEIWARQWTPGAWRPAARA